MEASLEPKEAVFHPEHYSFAKESGHEPIACIHAWSLNFNRGSAVKYLARAGRKDPRKEIEDLEKAVFYILHEIDMLRAKK